MKRAWIVLALAVVLAAGLLTAGHAWAFPSQSFHKKAGHVFDSWEICRSAAYGIAGFYQVTDSGFRPVIAFESLGPQAHVAYSLGEQFASKYPDRMQRAEAIFSFVRDRVQYTSDIDQSGTLEFAQNADELAISILENGLGKGDCEDMAVLLAVMYRAAGFRSAIVLLSEHTAALVYLPDYRDATVFFELDGEPGWIWAEATGRNNPLGWAPDQYLDMEIPAYELLAETPAYEIPSGAPAPLIPPPAPSIASAGMGQGAASPPYFFLIIIGLLLFLSLLRRVSRR